jgi:outer membrane protein
MKKYILSIAMISLFSVLGISQKFGFLNSQEIIALMPEMQEANSEIEVMKSMFSKKGQEMIQNLRDQYQDLQRKQASGEIAPIILEKESAKLKEEEEKIVAFEQSSQVKIYSKSEELFQPIQDKVNDAIKAVAAENGFVYIFDSSSGVVLYADETADVTAMVKAKLGLKI